MRSFSSSISRRICAWMVTSSAVVGSSAISSLRRAGQRHGDHRALAHAAGELVRIVAQRDARHPGCAPARSISAARASAARLPDAGGYAPPRRSASPTVCTGFRLVIGSWKIMRDAVAADVAHLLLATASADPAVEPHRATAARAFFGSSRITDSAVTLLPQPDSPTMPERLARARR